MRRSYQISLINLIVITLLILPLQGLMSASKINLTNDSSLNGSFYVENDLAKQRIEKGVSCDHCKQHICNEKCQCNNNKCFSSAAILPKTTCEKVLIIVDIKYRSFKEGLVIQPLSSLFRPPKQLAS